MDRRLEAAAEHIQSALNAVTTAASRGVDVLVRLSRPILDWSVDALESRTGDGHFAISDLGESISSAVASSHIHPALLGVGAGALTLLSLELLALVAPQKAKPRPTTQQRRALSHEPPELTRGDRLRMRELGWQSRDQYNWSGAISVRDGAAQLHAAFAWEHLHSRWLVFVHAPRGWLVTGRWSGCWYPADAQGWRRLNYIFPNILDHTEVVSLVAGLRNFGEEKWDENGRPLVDVGASV